MSRITQFFIAVVLLVVLAPSAYFAQTGASRTGGFGRLQLDDGIFGAGHYVFLSDFNGSLGVDANGTVTGTFPSNCALLDLSSTVKGFLPPRMTTAQEALICGGTPDPGLIVYNTTTNTLDIYNGSGWGAISGWTLAGNTLTPAGGGTGFMQNFIGTLNAQDFVIATNVGAAGSGVGERIRVNSTGNVSINTPDGGPANTLNVNGDENVMGMLTSTGNSDIGTNGGTNNTFGNNGANQNSIGSGANLNVIGNNANFNQFGGAAFLNTIGAGATTNNIGANATTNNIGITGGATTNNIDGPTNVNTTAADLTTIGANMANASTTVINVGTAGGNLTLNNIANDNTTVNLLTTTGVGSPASGNVRYHTLASLITGSNGVEVTYSGGSADAHFAPNNSSVLFANNRFINTNASTLTVTSGNPGTYTLLTAGGTTVGINNVAAGTTNVGVSAGTNNILGTTNVNVAGGSTTNIATGAAATTNIGITAGTNNILGATNINTSGAAITTIGSTATGGAVNVRTSGANPLTLDVGNLGNNLTLNNIANGALATDINFLVMTAPNSGNTRWRTLSSFITGSNGVEVTYVGGVADAHFAPNNASVIFANDRWINTDGMTLHIANGADYASFNSTASGINQAAANAGTTTIGNTTAGGVVAINSSVSTSRTAPTNTTTASAGNNTFTASAMNNLTGGTGNTMTATTGNNAITATAAQNVLTAGTTNNLTGGTGNNVTATTGNNTVTATTGNNNVVSTAGSNSMTAATTNTLTAGTTNNLTGGTGNNVTATTGNNTVTATTGNNNVTSTAGSNSMTAATTNTLTAGTTNNLTGGTGNNMTATTGNNTITSTAAQNVLNANTTNNLTGGTGNNVTATTGNNTLTSTAAQNVLNANTTNNLTGGTGNNVTATTGNNTITATTGNNAINSTAAANTMTAATTNTLTGGTGNTISATTGNNLLNAASAAGQNNITSTATGSNNITGPTNINTTLNGATTIGSLAGTGATIIRSNAAGSSITLDVANTATNNLTLNNINQDNTQVNLLTMTGVNNGNVRTRDLGTILTGSNGVEVTLTAGVLDAHLGDAATDVPFTSGRFINLDAQTLSFTRNGGANNVMVLTGGAVGQVNITAPTTINTGATYALTTIGNSTSAQQLRVQGVQDAAVGQTLAGNPSVWDLVVIGDQVTSGLGKFGGSIWIDGLSPVRNINADGPLLLNTTGGDVTVAPASAQTFVTGNLTASISITSTTGNIVAQTGNITAVAGDISATAGNLTALQNITAQSGDVRASNGNMVANNGRIGAGTGPGAPSSTLTSAGSFAANATAGGSTNLTIANYFYRVTVAGATVNLPAANSCAGRVYIIKDDATGTTTVGSGGGLIDGAAADALAAPNMVHQYISDGTNWYIISTN